MVILGGVLIHVAFFEAVGDGLALGSLAPWLLALCSVFVGTLASQSDYQVWSQRLFWILALVAGFVALPEVIQVASGQMDTIPAGMKEVWLMAAVAPVPLGLVVGAVKVWL